MDRQCQGAPKLARHLLYDSALLGVRCRHLLGDLENQIAVLGSQAQLLCNSHVCTLLQLQLGQAPVGARNTCPRPFTSVPLRRGSLTHGTTASPNCLADAFMVASNPASALAPASIAAAKCSASPARNDMPLVPQRRAASR